MVWIVTGAADLDGRALLRRAGGDDAEGRRPIRLSARSVLAALGISLRLDVVSRHSNRNHRGGRGRFRALHRRARAVGFGVELSDRADSFRQLRVFAFNRAIRRPADDRAADVHEHARA